MRVRVAYATARGSTRGIAERAGRVLCESGLDVVCASVSDRPDVEACDAAVVGSAVHDMAWLPAGAEFLRRNRAALETRPLWLFSVGMPAALRRPVRALATREEEARLARDLAAVVTAREHRLFSGVFERSDDQSLWGRLLFRVVSGRYGDLRDWAAVDAWARRIAADLAGDKARPGG